MRILHLASGDLWAGAEVQLYHLAVALSKLDGLDLKIVLLNHGQLGQELKNKDVDVSVLDESKLSGFKIMSGLNKIVKEFRPDVLHTHRFKENVIGGLVARRNRIKSVRTVHGASEFANQGFSLRRSVFATLDRLSGYLLQHKIIAVSDELKVSLSREYPAKKIEVIPNGIDPNYVHTKANETIGDQIPTSALNVVFVGRFVPVKRVDLYCDIARQAVLLNDNIHFYLIGDGPLKEQIEQQIEQNGLKDNVHLLGFKSNPLPYIKHMDLLMFTSDHEGLPMTLLEAMSLNVPVMSRKLATIEQTLCDGDCGFICDSDKAEDFAEMISAVARDPMQARAKAEQAKNILLEKYSLEYLVKSYISLYKKLSNNSRN